MDICRNFRIFVLVTTNDCIICQQLFQNHKAMKTKIILTFLVCILSSSVSAQTPVTTNKNDVYVETPILAINENSKEQTTFAAMRAPIIKKLNENPKVQAVENKSCTHKLLTVIQRYQRSTYRDSTNGKFYYKVEFYYTLAIKNTQKNEVLSQGMSKKGTARSEKSYADALAIACNTLPYQSDINEVVEESFALVGLITKIEPDAKKPKRAGMVYVDLGLNHGVRKNQWFDVFIVNNGNVSDRIATIHLDKAEANYSICKPKKNKEELLSLWNANQGAKFAVVSRMESNIFKKLEKALDFVTNIIDSY